MAQTIALQTKLPEFDPAKSIREGADARDAVTRSSLNSIKLQDYADESTALRSYRGRLAAGDKNAKQAIAGYPELQAKFHAAFKSMKPDEQDAAEKRTRSIASDAREVASLPEGSPERTAAWNRVIEKNRRLGYISDDQAKSAIANGPNDMLVNQALTAEKWLDSVVKGRPKAIPTFDELPIDDRLRIDEQARKEATSGISEYETVPPEQMEQRIAKARQSILARLYPPKGGAAAPAPSPGGSSLPGMPDPAAKPAAVAPADKTDPAKDPATIRRAAPMAERHSGGSSPQRFAAEQEKKAAGGAAVTEGAVTGKADTPQYSADNPARPASKDEYNALPINTPVLNRDGRILYKTQNLK